VRIKLLIVSDQCEKEMLQYSQLYNKFSGFSSLIAMSSI